VHHPDFESHNSDNTSYNAIVMVILNIYNKIKFNIKII